MENNNAIVIEQQVAAAIAAWLREVKGGYLTVADQMLRASACDKRVAEALVQFVQINHNCAGLLEGLAVQVETRKWTSS